MTLWSSSSVLRSWLAFLMVEVCKPLQMSAHCWTTFLQSGPTQGAIQLGLLTNLWTGSVHLLPKFKNFLGQVKDDFNLIEEFMMKSVGMTEPKQMATFIALGGIATALWFERESFSLWAELEDTF